MDEVLALDYDAFVDNVGREAVGSRTRNATLGLSTLKSAVRKYQKEMLLTDPVSEPSPNGG
jgi:nitrogen fixation NifU-like protein